MFDYFLHLHFTSRWWLFCIMSIIPCDPFFFPLPKQLLQTWWDFNQNKEWKTLSAIGFAYPFLHPMKRQCVCSWTLISLRASKAVQSWWLLKQHPLCVVTLVHSYSDLMWKCLLPSLISSVFKNLQWRCFQDLSQKVRSILKCFSWSLCCSFLGASFLVLRFM